MVCAANKHSHACCRDTTSECRGPLDRSFWIHGVGVDHFRDQFDALNLNFRKYLTNVCVKAVQEIVVLPKGLIGVPIAGVPLLDFWWHELSETEDVVVVQDLYMTMICSWSMLFFAVLLRWQIRRVYKQVFKAELLTQGGMGSSVYVSAKFERLVLVCIEDKFCNEIVRKHPLQSS